MLPQKKVSSSEEAKVYVEESERENFEGSYEKSSELSYFSFETRSILENK